jgi:hypothetical protein
VLENHEAQALINKKRVDESVYRRLVSVTAGGAAC